MTRITGRAFVVWLLLIAAESVHGVLRAMFLVLWPATFGHARLERLSARSLVGAQSSSHLLAVGASRLVLMLGFESGLGRYGFGYSWQRMLEDYDIRRGGLLTFGMVVLVLPPMIAASRRHLCVSA